MAAVADLAACGDNSKRVLRAQAEVGRQWRRQRPPLLMATASVATASVCGRRECVDGEIVWTAALCLGGGQQAVVGSRRQRYAMTAVAAAYLRGGRRLKV